MGRNACKLSPRIIHFCFYHMVICRLLQPQELSGKTKLFRTGFGEFRHIGTIN